MENVYFDAEKDISEFLKYSQVNCVHNPRLSIYTQCHRLFNGVMKMDFNEEICRRAEWSQMVMDGASRDLLLRGQENQAKIDNLKAMTEKKGLPW